MCFRRRYTRFAKVVIKSNGAMDTRALVGTDTLARFDTAEIGRLPAIEEYSTLFRKFRLLRVTWTMKLMHVDGRRTADDELEALTDIAIVPLRMRHCRIKPPYSVPTPMSYSGLDQYRTSSRTFGHLGDTTKYSVPLWVNTQLSDVSDVLETNYGLKWAPILPFSTAGIGAAHGLAVMAFQSTPIAAHTGYKEYLYYFQYDVVYDFACYEPR